MTIIICNNFVFVYDYSFFHNLYFVYRLHTLCHLIYARPVLTDGVNIFFNQILIFLHGIFKFEISVHSLQNICSLWSVISIAILHFVSDPFVH
jgi:hypothetical protein